MKNSFLLLQTSNHPEDNRGFWVLTLRPKLGMDGKPPFILMEKSKPVTAAQLPEYKGPQ
jgi:hypothetical protein